MTLMTPRYLTIKTELLRDIEAGRLVAGEQVASENQLAERFAVSRMTARRALTELVEAGILARTQGLGTFVADSRPMGSVLTIIAIEDEVRARGHSYQCDVVHKEKIYANREQSNWLGLPENSLVYFTRIIHFENDLPVQLEERVVNPVWAPQYLEQDFTRISANKYLGQVAPLTEADHIIQALLPDTDTAALLQLSPAQPCLQIHRRTFSHRGIVSVALLTHPGNRYRLGGHLDFMAAKQE